MRVDWLPIRGAALLHGVMHVDERGSFRRVVDMAAMAGVGLDTRVAQVSVATNLESGTLRGLHYQAEPYAEAKTMWCSAGSVFDVLVDLRPGEPTYGHPWSTTLTVSQPIALHVPGGVAHGYQTLDDNSEMTYLISTPFRADSARSLQALDPALSIAWPLSVTRMSPRDTEAPAWPPLY